MCAHKASDLILTSGHAPQVKVDGQLEAFGDESLTPADIEAIGYQLLNEHQRKHFESEQSVDFASGFPGLGRFRFNLFRQRGSLALVARFIPFDIPRFEDLGVPEVVKELALMPHGLILFTGATGSGKSTSMAAVIDHVNANRKAHIVCLEDPVEFLHHHQLCTVEQREIGTDAPSFARALRDVFRQAPDVIMVGEMRDLETMELALKLAETGHLVMGTLHTQDTSQAISRIVDSFPPGHQQQVYTQLSMVLCGVISQKLLRRADDNGRALACEVMVATAAVRNLIREHQLQQIYSVLQMGRDEKMMTMNGSLLGLVESGAVAVSEALRATSRPDELKRMMAQKGVS